LNAYVCVGSDCGEGCGGGECFGSCGERRKGGDCCCGTAGFCAWLVACFSNCCSATGCSVVAGCCIVAGFRVADRCVVVGCASLVV
jgi:hypothetical protein